MCPMQVLHSTSERRVPLPYDISIRTNTSIVDLPILVNSVDRPDFNTQLSCC